LSKISFSLHEGSNSSGIALALRLSNLTSRPGHRLLEAISLKPQDGLINADADPRDLNGGPKAYRECLRQAALFALNRTG
jgi:hypothetical protein